MRHNESQRGSAGEPGASDGDPSLLAGRAVYAFGCDQTERIFEY
jgi:hypothetical protein